MSTLENARLLLSQGRVAEAERACERVLEHTPDSVEALNVCAIASLRDGKNYRAVAMLERATRARPDDAISQHNLGRAYESVGNLDGAIDALARAVQLRPVYHVARIRLAALLDARGQAERAVLHYARALDDAQRQGRWLDAAGTPASLRPMVERGIAALRAHRRAALLRPARHAGWPLRPRVRWNGSSAACASICARSVRNTPIPGSSRPSSTCRACPRRRIFRASCSRGCEAFEACTTDIREELLAVLPSETGRERVFTSEELERQNLRAEQGPPTWNGYYFYRHGERRDDNCARCPRAAAAIDALPLSRVPEHGPGGAVLGVHAGHAPAATPGRHQHPRRRPPAADRPARLRAARRR